MKPILLNFLRSMLLVLLTTWAYGQTPPHPMALLNSTGNNAFPFNTTTNKKTQFLIRPSDWGANIPGGLIDTLWFRNANSTTSNGPGTYSNLQIRMGQFTSTVFPGAGSLEFYTPAQLTTVLSAASYTINQTTSAGGWYYIPLTTPFPFDPTLTLCVDVEMDNRTSTTGFQSATFTVGSAPNHQRLTSTTNGATTGSASSILSDIGLSLAPLLGLDGAVQRFDSPVSPLTGGTTSQVNIFIQNRGTNPMTSATVAYQLDTNPPITEAWTGSLSSFGGINHTFATNLTVPTTQTFQLKAWIANPNGLGPDLNTTNDTITRTFCLALPGGTYTVGGGLANYATVQDAITAITCGGIAGPVTFLINPGTYIGSYSIPALPGNSSAFSITFTSATGIASDVVLRHDTAATGSNITFNINTPNVTFNSLTFERTVFGSALAGCIQASVGANSLTVTSCRFIDLSGSTSTNNQAIRVDGADFVNITGNYFNGFYYDFFGNGITTNSGYSQGLVFIANTMENYRYGFYAVNQSGAIVSGNTCTDVNTASTFGYGLYTSRTIGLTMSDNRVLGRVGNMGIYILNPNIDSLGTENRVFNNLVSGTANVSSTIISYGLYAGGSFSTSTTINPLNPRDQVAFVNNTVNLVMSSTSTSVYGAGIHITGGSTTTPAFSSVTVLNNLVNLTADAGPFRTNIKGIYYSGQWVIDSLTANNNAVWITNANGTPSGTDLFWNNSPATGYTSVSAWSTASGRDALSLSVSPDLISANIARPTSLPLDNKGTPVAYVQSDIEGLSRSATTPDIGAYEFLGLQFSQITVTPLADTLLSAGRTITINIVDTTGLITGAANGPRMFYNKNGGAWAVDSVPVVSGSVFTFSFNYAALGGVQQLDTIQYYFATLNTPGVVTTSPLGGSGNSPVGSTPPPSVYDYQILAQISGNYRVGVSQANADFATITAAVNFINAGLVVGSANFMLIDSAYGAGESFPIVLNPINGSSRTNHIRFTVDSSRSEVLVSGSSTQGLIHLNGVSNFEINGAGATGGRALHIANSSQASGSMGIWVQSTLAAGVDSLIIANTRISGGTNTVATNYALYVAGTTVSTSGTGDNMRLVRIEGNELRNAYYGLYLRGTTTSAAQDVTISGNLIGDTATSNTISAKGMDLQNLNNGLVEGNEIRNITGTFSFARSGIEFGGTGSQNLVVNANKIYGVFTPAANGAHGLYVISGNGMRITNNVIYDIRTQNGSNTSQTSNASGIRLSSGTGHQVYYNSVHLYGTYTNASTAGAASAALTITSTAVASLDIRNNVFSNTMNTNSTGLSFFNAVWLPTSYAMSNLTINNNAYHVDTTANHEVGRIGTTTTAPVYVDVAAWKAITETGVPGNDAFSVPPTGRSVAPFISNTNLEIVPGTTTGIESGAVVIAALGTPNRDFNGTNRPGGTGQAPDMGAYEFNGVLLPDLFPPTIDSATITPPESQCAVTPRAVSVWARDNIGGVGIDSAFIRYTVNGIQQADIVLTRISGTPASGNWTGTLPAAALPNQTIEASVVVRDTNGNFSAVTRFMQFADDYLAVNAGNDTTITAGDTATLRAATTGFAGSVVVDANRQGGNGQVGVSFNVRAISGIVLDSLYVPLYGTVGNIATVDVWYNTTPVNGAPTVTAANGWTQIVTAAPATIRNTGTTGGAQVSGVAVPGNITIPAGQTYGFFYQVTNGSTVYTSWSAANQDTFTDGNIVIYTGQNIGYGGSAPNPTFHPRQFNGSVGYKSSATVRWTTLGSATVLGTGDSLRVAPAQTTTYVATLTDSICFKTDTVTVFVNPLLTDDIGVTAILTPTAVPALNQPYQVKVVIENFGTTPATGFDVAYSVNGVEINANAISRTVPAGDTIHHIFTQAWTPTVGGTVRLCGYSKWSTDIDLSNDTTCANFLNVSVEDPQGLMGRVYPNPANDWVLFELSAPATQGTQLVILDAAGKEVARILPELGVQNIRFETQRLAAGAYQYRIERENGVGVGKLMIVR